jgi:hypothetical protein
MIETFSKAISILLDGKTASYSSENNKILEWNPVESGLAQPTEAEIAAKMVELEAEWTANEYARNRQAEYPDWGTQLEKIADDGIDKWKSEMLAPVKAKFPKP